MHFVIHCTQDFDNSTRPVISVSLMSRPAVQFFEINTLETNVLVDSFAGEEE